MSLIGTLSKIGQGVGLFSGVGGLFGGGGQNVARGFSAECGLSSPISQTAADAIKAEARQRGLDPVALCRQLRLGTATQPGGGVITPGGPPVLAGPGLPSIIRKTIPALPRLGGAAGVVRTATGRISSVLLPSGQRVSANRIRAFIRKWGIPIAATAFGLSELELAEIATTAPKRRRKGITGAQLANAKRTICMVNKMAKDLNCKPTTRRRTTCR